jgi:hypothetical protein
LDTLLRCALVGNIIYMKLTKKEEKLILARRKYCATYAWYKRLCKQHPRVFGADHERRLDALELVDNAREDVLDSSVYP